MTTRQKLFWVSVLYFAEGFPFGLLIDAFPIYFRLHGVSLVQIGLLSGVGLAWTLKWLWAPAVDLWGSRRRWIVGCQVLLAVGLLVVLLLDPSRIGQEFWAVLLVLAVLSATQDIAIDAYTIGLLDKAELGPGNGARVTAYRISLIVSGGLFVALAGLVGWNWCFVGAALVMGLLAVGCSRSPNEASSSRGSHPERPLTLQEAMITPVRYFQGIPGFAAIALFVVTFKLGDMALGPMIKPFWVDQAFTPIEIGLIPGTIGVVSTIAGALLGGSLTERWGIFRALWVSGIFQAGSNLAYVAAANHPSPPLMYSASVVESFCGGLGTTPFLAFLMSLCTKAHAATQYALLSALFGLTRGLAGTFSGAAAQHFGYTTYFFLTCLMALPAFALLPWVRRWADGTVTVRREA